MSATVLQVSDGVTPLRARAAEDGPQETQMLFGELFEVEKEEAGWAYGKALFDGYQGWVELDALAAPVSESTHYVSALRTFRFSAPDLKSPPLGIISMNAKAHFDGTFENRFVKEARGGWVFADHLKPVGSQAKDYVAVAEMFLGAPYFWGGRESTGLDCSALVQNAMEQAGRNVPRDSGPQRAHFGQDPEGELFGDGDGAWQAMSLQRGDLTFWKGHVGIMVDGERMIHANATYMAVTINDVREFAARIAGTDGDVLQISRPAF